MSGSSPRRDPATDGRQRGVVHRNGTGAGASRFEPGGGSVGRPSRGKAGPRATFAGNSQSLAPGDRAASSSRHRRGALLFEPARCPGAVRSRAGRIPSFSPGRAVRLEGALGRFEICSQRCLSSRTMWCRAISCAETFAAGSKTSLATVSSARRSWTWSSGMGGPHETPFDASSRSGTVEAQHDQLRGP